MLRAIQVDDAAAQDDDDDEYVLVHRSQQQQVPHRRFSYNQSGGPTSAQPVSPCHLLGKIICLNVLRPGKLTQKQVTAKFLCGRLLGDQQSDAF